MGINLQSLDYLIDSLFGIDSASPPMIREGGSMRPAVCTALAPMIMYYEERINANEMLQVNVMRQKLVGAARAGFTSEGVAGAHGLLLHWSAAITDHFKLDNLFLDTASNDIYEATEQIVKAVGSLGGTVGKLHTQVNAVSRQVADEVGNLKVEVALLRDVLS
jgi:hypothetical protein